MRISVYKKWDVFGNIEKVDCYISVVSPTYHYLEGEPETRSYMRYSYLMEITRPL